MSQTLTVLSVEVVMTSQGSRGLNWMLVTLFLCNRAFHTFSPKTKILLRDHSITMRLHTLDNDRIRISHLSLP